MPAVTAHRRRAGAAAGGGRPMRARRTAAAPARDGGAAPPRRRRRPRAPAARATARAEHAQAMAQLRAGRVDAGGRAVRRRRSTHDPGNAGYATDYGFALGAPRPPRRGGGVAARRDRQGSAPRLRVGQPRRDLRRRSDALGTPRRDRRVSREGSRRDQGGRKAALQPGPRHRQLRTGDRAHARRRARGSSRCSPSTPNRRCPARSASACWICSDAIALDDRAHALEDWPRPEIARDDAAQADAAARALDSGRADDALAIADALVQRYPTWARALVLRARALEADRPRGRGGARSRDRGEPRPVQCARLADAGQDPGAARRRAGGRARRRGPAQRADAGAGLDRSARAARQAGDAARRRQAARGAAGSATLPSDIARGLYQQAEEWIRRRRSGRARDASCSIRRWPTRPVSSRPR